MNYEDRFPEHLFSHAYNYDGKKTKFLQKYLNVCVRNFILFVCEFFTYTGELLMSGLTYLNIIINKVSAAEKSYF